MRKSTRDDNLIKLQYDQGIWEEDLSRINNASSLSDYLFPQDSNMILRRVGKYCAKLTTNENYLRKKAILLAGTFKGKEEICEIGCGSGWNLMALRYMGYKGKLAGIDISENGIKSIELANQKWDLNIQTRVGDMRSAEIFQSPLIQASRTLFTFLALEQLPKETEMVLGHLKKYAKTKEIILLESSRELFPFHYSELLSKIYTSKRDYLRTLKKYMKRNEIDHQIERVKFSHRIGNEIAIWRLGSNQ